MHVVTELYDHFTISVRSAAGTTLTSRLLASINSAERPHPVHVTKEE